MSAALKDAFIRFAQALAPLIEPNGRINCPAAIQGTKRFVAELEKAGLAKELEPRGRFVEIACRRGSKFAKLREKARNAYQRHRPEPVARFEAVLVNGRLDVQGMENTVPSGRQPEDRFPLQPGEHGPLPPVVSGDVAKSDVEEVRRRVLILRGDPVFWQEDVFERQYNAVLYATTLAQLESLAGTIERNLYKAIPERARKAHRLLLAECERIRYAAGIHTDGYRELWYFLQVLTNPNDEDAKTNIVALDTELVERTWRTIVSAAKDILPSECDLPPEINDLLIAFASDEALEQARVQKRRERANAAAVRELAAAAQAAQRENSESLRKIEEKLAEKNEQIKQVGDSTVSLTVVQLDVLRVLSEERTAPLTLTQIEARLRRTSRNARGSRTLRDALKPLEMNRLASRPHGRNRGYVITPVGRQFLGQTVASK